eukprot:scaffold24732_cov122-Isochrysis_galbana.AAC.4
MAAAALAAPVPASAGHAAPRPDSHSEWQVRRRKAVPRSPSGAFRGQGAPAATERCGTSF